MHAPMDLSSPLAIGLLAAAVAVGALAAGLLVTSVGPADPSDTAPTDDGGDDGPPETTRSDQVNVSDSTSPLVTLVEADVETEVLNYTVHGPDGRVLGNATYRVVQGTGNCCENHLTTTPNGRIVDLGGTYPVYSLDDGATWTRVEPVTPFVNGEGTLVVAPDGDILGPMWDPYTGDRLVAFKWDAQTQEWDYREAPLKSPFFDRPWVSVLPGPHAGSDVGGEDYVAYVRGGIPKEGGYVSYDGLTYVRPSSPNMEAHIVGTSAADAVPDPLPAKAWADWVQPHTESHITPLPSGGALATHGFIFGLGADCPVKRTTDQLQWRCFDLPGYEGGRLLVDSRGRLHNVRASGSQVTYRIDAEIGGPSWTGTTVDLPSRYEVEDWDFKVHAGLGDALVALHVHDAEAEADQDMVLRLNITGDRAVLTHRYEVGHGDLQSESGVGNDVRFDFTTLGFLPDGRFVVSFVDADHHPPSLAVLLEDVGDLAEA